MKNLAMRLLFLGVLAVSLAACSSISKGRTQQIKFKSDPPGATISLNQFAICKTPCMAEVSRKEKGIWEATLYGKQPQARPVEKHLNGEFIVGNLLLGGIPGWLIDSANSSMYDFDQDSLYWIFDDKNMPVVTYKLLLDMKRTQRAPIISGLRNLEKAEIAETARERIKSCDPATGEVAFNKANDPGERTLLRQLCAAGIFEVVRQ